MQGPGSSLGRWKLTVRMGLVGAVLRWPAKECEKGWKNNNVQDDYDSVNDPRKVSSPYGPVGWQLWMLAVEEP